MNIIISPDEYNYGLNNNHAPFRSLASHDTICNVTYIGSICKTIATVYRVGYHIGFEKFIDQAAEARRMIDRQGDALLELTFAHFIKSGDLDRHIRKVLKIYQQRRDLFCQLLKDELSDYFECEIPIGGMAVWVKLKQGLSWEDLCNEARKHKLEIGNWQRYDHAMTGHNCIRIGFASQNDEEIFELVQRLRRSVESCG